MKDRAIIGIPISPGQSSITVRVKRPIKNDFIHNAVVLRILPGNTSLAIAAIEYSIAADSSPYPDSLKSPAPLISSMALMAAAVYPSHCHSIEAPAANAITAAKAYMYHRRPR